MTAFCHIGIVLQCICMNADTWVAKVRNGRLQLDVATDLPEGEEVPLVWSLPVSVEEARCDILLFVTTETEREAMREYTTGRPTRNISGRYSDYVDLGWIHPLYRVFVVETEMGALQAGGSATKALLCTVETGARFIISVGTAFGIDRDRQEFGDVIVATHVLPYDSVIVDTDRDGRLPRIRYDRARPTPTNSALVSLLRRHVAGQPPSFEVHFGAILSGNAQIRCAAYRDHLVAKFDKKLTDLDQQHRSKGRSLVERVVGGEMEGIGLITMPPANDETRWLVVKGISDFADEEHGNENRSNRRLACEHAIELVLGALASAPLPAVRAQAGES